MSSINVDSDRTTDTLRNGGRRIYTLRNNLFDDRWIMKKDLRIISTLHLYSLNTHLNWNALANKFGAIPKHLNHPPIELLFFIQMLYT